jgi:hypothetical protein
VRQCRRVAAADADADRWRRNLTMDIGPVEYMAVAFPGNKFKGDIAPALAELVEAGTIRIIDLAFVGKDAQGNVIGMELEELDSNAGKAFGAIQEKVGDLISEADLHEIGESLEPNSSAAVLVWEDVWATKFVKAMREAGGVLIDLQRIPVAVMEEALEFAKAK